MHAINVKKKIKKKFDVPVNAILQVIDSWVIMQVRHGRSRWLEFQIIFDIQVNSHSYNFIADKNKMQFPYKSNQISDLKRQTVFLSKSYMKFSTIISHFANRETSPYMLNKIWYYVPSNLQVINLDDKLGGSLTTSAHMKYCDSLTLRETK